MQTIDNSGLVYWNEREIKLRNQIAEDIILQMYTSARVSNKQWTFNRIEAPVLINKSLIHPNYDETDYYTVDEELALRPETTATSYLYAVDYLKHYSKKKALPFCVVQLGLSFRKEQDKTLKHMRLKSFYQLEFQFLYSADSKADYVTWLRNAAENAINNWYPFVDQKPSDRLPCYSNSTEDIITVDENPMELASMSDRTDFPDLNIRNVEIAIGIDRLLTKVMDTFYSQEQEND